MFTRTRFRLKKHLHFTSRQEKTAQYRWINTLVCLTAFTVLDQGLPGSGIFWNADLSRIGEVPLLMFGSKRLRVFAWTAELVFEAALVKYVVRTRNILPRIDKTMLEPYTSVGQEADKKPANAEDEPFEALEDCTQSSELLRFQVNLCPPTVTTTVKGDREFDSFTEIQDTKDRFWLPKHSIKVALEISSTLNLVGFTKTFLWQPGTVSTTSGLLGSNRSRNAIRINSRMCLLLSFTHGALLSVVLTLTVPNAGKKTHGREHNSYIPNKRMREREYVRVPEYNCLKLVIGGGLSNLVQRLRTQSGLGTGCNALHTAGALSDLDQR
ncbi:hypothetical protein CLF_102481 [Clonorchis sinensis]|uniref:Uncharacterized protein n=1 Tax=Clonorchis sinensis TaxID=79923 RepID=G7Y812_CLOSI|nr:hypothetical protein CLF_102481 [Clonorchis sinensis]